MKSAFFHQSGQKSSKVLAFMLFTVLLLSITGLFVQTRPAHAAGSRYVGAFFNKTTRSLEIITSSDALNFSVVYNGGFVGIGYTLRDPSIYKHTDGKYYVAYTATNDASCCNPENRFGIAVSSDLVNWSNFLSVNAGVTGVINTWAPEWYVDSDGSINLLVSINTNATNYTTYRYTALNSALTSWSAPVAILGPNVIDTIIVKVGNVYHAFPKNANTQYIEHATASNLNGPYTYVGTGNWAGWSTHREGPSLIKLDNGKWRMYLDTYSTTGILYSDGNSDFTGWTTPAVLPNIGSTLQHGTVIDQGTGVGPTSTRTPTPSATTNLAQGKTVSADSVQAANPAANAVDGSTTTRWAAANGNTGHWLTVDLGSSRNISSTQVMWEFARNYKYKIETSTDNATWTLRADKTASASTAQNVTDTFTITARYVRITVTGLTTSPISWASLFEFRVFGN